MFPRTSFLYRPNESVCDAVIGRDIAVGTRVCANGDDILCCDLSETNGPANAAHPVFFLGIAHVICVCAKQQMLGPHARRSVTTVHDLNAWPDGAMCEHPRHAMRVEVSSEIWTLYPRVVLEPTIPLVIKATAPQPAGISFEDFRPESFFAGDMLAFSHKAIASSDCTVVRGAEGPTSLRASFIVPQQQESSI